MTVPSREVVVVVVAVIAATVVRSAEARALSSAETSPRAARSLSEAERDFFWRCRVGGASWARAGQGRRFTTRVVDQGAPSSRMYVVFCSASMSGWDDGAVHVV